MHLAWVMLVPLAFASICPLKEHQVCNLRQMKNNYDHKCTCAITRKSEMPPPEQSCNNLIIRDPNSGTFPVVSVEFDLTNTIEHDEWNEDSFRDTIAATLRIDNEDILVLRVNCQGTEDSLTVQFAVLRKNANTTKDTPYEMDDFIDAKSTASRMRDMGHLSKIADLEVDTIKFTEEIIDIEFEPDNSELIVQAILVGTGVAFMFILGIWMSCRNKGYSDDLQKA
uniref:ZP domain-containing protein n=1 Tax=Heterorhabditis bacteriophora TaxID=37862 RepID=A0A1I7XQ79_HETBA